MNAQEITTQLATFSCSGRYWLMHREQGLDLDLGYCADLDDLACAVLDCLTAGEPVDQQGEPCDLEAAWSGWEVVRAD